MMMTEPLLSPTASQAIHPSIPEQYQRVAANIGKVILGKDDVIARLLWAVAAQGHVLFRDVPGVGKTMLAKAFAASVDCTFKRIQFTPDLLPMDVTGSNVFDMRAKTFQFHAGPIFTNVLLADEINRAPPKTQSALLEVMEERQVTVEGTTHKLALPFIAIATMNPLEDEGTYPLPAAQLDRFMMMLSVGYPPEDAEMKMLEVHLGHSPALGNLEPVISKHVCSHGKPRCHTSTFRPRCATTSSRCFARFAPTIATCDRSRRARRSCSREHARHARFFQEEISCPWKTSRHLPPTCSAIAS
ncbi:MAG: AAA family ATPase [Polyangiaceae bacterium]|nr:AAA family ATPase [Polyangiaceae bacterium]